MRRVPEKGKEMGAETRFVGNVVFLRDTGKSSANKPKAKKQQ